MRIAHIAHGMLNPDMVSILPPLLIEQKSRGHDVFLFAPKSGLPKLTGIEVVSLRRAKPLWQGTDKNRDRRPLFANQVREQIIDCCPDVVHDHTGLTGFTERSSLPPVLVTLRDGLPQAHLFQENWDNALFVTASRWQREHLRRVGVPVIDEYVYYPVSGVPELLSQRLVKRQRKLLWLGHMVPRYGPELAIEVARRSRHKLVMAGEPAAWGDRQLWYRSFADIIDDKTIEHFGELRDQDRPGFFRGAAALVVPYRCYDNRICDAWEPPLENPVLVQALAAGVPIIGTACQATQELAGNAGLLTEASDDQSLVDGIVASLENLSSISVADCRGRALLFRPTFAADKLERIYQRAINA
jgi:glycosyltransferase involved in cell wall biosynthesis